MKYSICLYAKVSMFSILGEKGPVKVTPRPAQPTQGQGLGALWALHCASPPDCPGLSVWLHGRLTWKPRITPQEAPGAGAATLCQPCPSALRKREPQVNAGGT